MLGVSLTIALGVGWENLFLKKTPFDVVGHRHGPCVKKRKREGDKKRKKRG